MNTDSASQLVDRSVCPTCGAPVQSSAYMIEVRSGSIVQLLTLGDGKVAVLPSLEIAHSTLAALRAAIGGCLPLTFEIVKAEVQS